MRKKVEKCMGRILKDFLFMKSRSDRCFETKDRLKVPPAGS